MARASATGFMERTGVAIEFLKQLEDDRAMAERCARTDLDGRLSIAREAGLPCGEDDLRAAVRLWDYSGAWNHWLFPGRLDESASGLPPLTSPYLVTNATRAAFSHDGHVVLRSVLSESELASYRPVIRGAVARYSADTAVTDPGTKAFTQVVNLRARNEAARSFALAPRFAGIAARLLDVPSVRVYLDQALFKEPGGKETAWHQDNLYFPLGTDSVVTLWTTLVDVTHQMGSLMFASGSHVEGYLGYQPISDEADARFDRLLAERGHPITANGDMAAGDISCHHGWTIHRAPPNGSDRRRESAVIVYYPDGTRLAKPENPYQARALELGFRGLRVGDAAGGPLHPIVDVPTACPLDLNGGDGDTT